MSNVLSICSLGARGHDVLDIPTTKRQRARDENRDEFGQASSSSLQGREGFRQGLGAYVARIKEQTHDSADVLSTEAPGGSRH
jgi:hypothetical protein